MTSPRLVPFKVEHMLAFIDHHNYVLPEMRFADLKERGGPAFTAMLDNKVVGCAGVMVLWPGVGHAWLTVDKAMEKHGIWLTRIVRSILQDTMRALNLHRIEAVSINDHRWLHVLGFHIEENSFARKYTQDKQDVVRYEIVK